MPAGERPRCLPFKCAAPVSSRSAGRPRPRSRPSSGRRPGRRAKSRPARRRGAGRQRARTRPARAAGPRPAGRRRRRRVSDNVAKSTAPTSAVPSAAPSVRENCTDAAAAPSRFWPATACTVTCTTLMTVPMKRALKPSRHGSSVALRCGDRAPAASGQRSTTTRPMDGTIGGPAGVADDVAGERADADADRQREEQEPGLARRSAVHDAQVDRHEGEERYDYRAVAGGQRIAAPDRRMAEQRDRKERRAPPGAPAR